MTQATTTRRAVPARGVRWRGAFTLFELLVVVVIVLVLLSVMAPSVAELVKSNNFSAAVNQLSGTLEAARERAIAQNKQTAVAVLFDVETERCRLQILDERSNRGDLAEVVVDTLAQDATVFAPAQNSTPVLLPEGTMVFGLSQYHFLPDGDEREEQIDSILSQTAMYEDRLISRGESEDEEDEFTPGWYVGSVIADPDDTTMLVNTWLAPRNDPRQFMDPRLGERDIDAPLRELGAVELKQLWRVARGETTDIQPGLTTDRADAVRYIRNAQSFMIRFSPQGTVIAFDADTTQADQSGYAFLDFPEGPIATGDSAPTDEDGNPVPFDNPQRFDPETATRDRTVRTQSPPPIFMAEDAAPNPEVVLRATSRLAVVDLQDLQEATAIARPWLLHTALTDPDHMAPWPDVFVASDGEELMSGSEELDRLVVEMSRWIDENAVVIDFSRFSGRVVKR